jgi:hypothetical protein
MDTLEPNQLEALNQLRDLTNGGDDDVAIGVLSSVDWDVQVSTVIFTAIILYNDDHNSEQQK